MDGDDYLVAMCSGVINGPIIFPNQRSILDYFKPFYDAMLQDSNIEMVQEFGMRLAIIYPVILKFKPKKIRGSVDTWRQDGMIYQPETMVLPVSHFLYKMRAGFVDEFSDLDIFRDIESKITVSSDGKMNLRRFEIVRSYKGEAPDCRESSEELLERLLRERGLK